MPTFWILHREDRARDALVRLLGESDAVVGRPGDARFDDAPRADAVVLGLAGDWEAELEFAHRHRARLGAARWVLIGEKEGAEAAAALFDRLPIEYLAYPPPAEALRRATRPPTPARPPLSQRARREAVSARFSRWLADLELPALLRALDPRLADVPVVVCGEPGTGRSTAIRYAHHFGGTADGALAHIPCDGDVRRQEIEDALVELGRSRPRLPGLCVWLDDPGRLPARVQRELAAWLEAGPPPGVRAPTLRWLASVDTTGPALDPTLARALGALEIRLPPLREQPERIEAVARGVIDAWCAPRHEAPRRLDPDALALLREYPWPGNLRELEAVLEQTLAATAQDPIDVDALRLGAAAPAPIDASEIGTMLPDEEAVEIEEAPHRAGAGPWVPAPIVSEPAPEPPPPPRAAAPRDADPGLRRLANALIHQVRNPLSTIRTFADLLPERFDDPDFRARFPEMVREDVGRIHGLLRSLEQLAALDAPQREKVDVSSLLEEVLEARRGAFRSRHLLVLKELDSSRPTALADPGHLRLAFEALLDKALAIVPERGDVYLASRRHEGGPSGPPAVRVLLRFHDPSVGESTHSVEHSIELLVAELVVRAQGGRFTLAASEAEERVLVVDLPSP